MKTKAQEYFDNYITPTLDRLWEQSTNSPTMRQACVRLVRDLPSLTPTEIEMRYVSVFQGLDPLRTAVLKSVAGMIQGSTAIPTATLTKSGASDRDQLKGNLHGSLQGWLTADFTKRTVLAEVNSQFPKPSTSLATSSPPVTPEQPVNKLKRTGADPCRSPMTPTIGRQF